MDAPCYGGKIIAGQFSTFATISALSGHAEHSLLFVRFRGQSGHPRAPLIGRSSLMDACQKGESRAAIARTFAIHPTTFWTA
jgi:hypothetical protein